jgi:hypothetical protein
MEQGAHQRCEGSFGPFDEDVRLSHSFDKHAILGSVSFAPLLAPSSGYEVSMCSEAIFGTDIDVLSWDYAMADSGTGNTLLHYGYRAGLNPGRPALVGIHIDRTSSNSRLSRLQELQAMGLAVFWTSTDEEAKMRDAIPDTEGLSEEQIRTFPPFVRNFKCSGTVERGEPHCSDEKFNLALCPLREGMTSWHYGWYVFSFCPR